MYPYEPYECCNISSTSIWGPEQLVLLFIRLRLIDSTSAIKMLQTGLWSENLDSPRTYDNWFRPLPYHKIRSHLHEYIKLWDFRHYKKKEMEKCCPILFYFFIILFLLSCAKNLFIAGRVVSPTMLVFVSSLLNEKCPQHIDLNYSNIYRWVGRISFLHSIPERHVHVSALSGAATK